MSVLDALKLVLRTSDVIQRHIERSFVASWRARCPGEPGRVLSTMAAAPCYAPRVFLSLSLLLKKVVVKRKQWRHLTRDVPITKAK